MRAAMIRKTTKVTAMHAETMKDNIANVVFWDNAVIPNTMVAGMLMRKIPRRSLKKILFNLFLRFFLLAP